jgi:hypothetical protein
LYKTGGQTLATRLASAFSFERTHIIQTTMVHGRHNEELQGLIATKDFIASHVDGPLLRGIDNVDLMASVRHPVDRIISAYRHMKRAPNVDTYRPINELSPRRFFELFENYFVNDQAKSLVSLLFKCPLPAQIGDFDRWLFDHLHPMMDVFRWLVPTEKIDEFINLWSLEAQIPVPYPAVTVNDAPPDDVNILELRKLLHEMSHLYSLDLYLWLKVHENFAQYRTQVFSSSVPGTDSGNVTRAFFNDGSGVWCRLGWHLPARTSTGRIEWAAGPGKVSELEIVAAKGEREIHFVFAVFVGIGADDISFYRKSDLASMTPRFSQLPDGSCAVSLPIGGFQPHESILLVVLRVKSSMQESATDNDPTRFPYKICEVRLN